METEDKYRGERYMKGSARDRWKQMTNIDGKRYMKGSARDRWKHKTQIEVNVT